MRLERSFLFLSALLKLPIWEAERVHVQHVVFIIAHYSTNWTALTSRFSLEAFGPPSHGLGFPSNSVNL